MKTKKGKMGFIAIKIDLEKAYDRSFLQNTLEDIGFNTHFTSLIMECASSNNIQVVWNEELTNVFLPSRRIKQGEPLSPYIFVLCGETDAMCKVGS